MQRFAAVADPDAPPSDLDGVSFVRLTGPLFFANADTLRDRVATAAEGQVGWVLLDFESVTDVDPTASEALAEAVALLQAHSKVIGIARASSPVRELLDTYGLTEDIGAEHLYATNREAMRAYLGEGHDAPS